MADILEAKLSSVEIPLGTSEIYAFARFNKGSRPSDVIFRIGDMELVERSFAQLRFASDHKKLVPVLEFVQWKDFVIAIGLTRMLILHEPSSSLIESAQLFRSAHEDSGFYKLRADVCGHTLIVSYESGVASVNEDGRMEWHREKSWSDTLTTVDQSVVILEDEAGAQSIIDSRTGELKDES
ncbi:hypothetical protein [Inquilinus sp. OTU3971]|uniref:hypothetical protein n=1 Tax=Inquilinus sp. OTU3971 TaxID=3043855 RepID=UPI00313B5BCD